MTAHELKVIVGWAAAYGAIAGLAIVLAFVFGIEWVMGRRRGNNAR